MEFVRRLCVQQPVQFILVLRNGLSFRSEKSPRRTLKKEQARTTYGGSTIHCSVSEASGGMSHSSFLLHTTSALPAIQANSELRCGGDSTAVRGRERGPILHGWRVMGGTICMVMLGQEPLHSNSTPDCVASSTITRRPVGVTLTNVG
jgi:hypothetical protein